MTGGLAEVSTTQRDADRLSLTVGDVRVLDFVGKGPNMVVECKGAKRDPVRADPKEILKLMTLLVDRLGKKSACSG